MCLHTHTQSPHLSDWVQGIIPMTLQLIDDFDNKNKMLGAHIIAHLVATLTPTELRWNGDLYYEVRPSPARQHIQRYQFFLLFFSFLSFSSHISSQSVFDDLTTPLQTLKKNIRFREEELVQLLMSTLLSLLSTIEPNSRSKKYSSLVDGQHFQFAVSYVLYADLTKELLNEIQWNTKKELLKVLFCFFLPFFFLSPLFSLFLSFQAASFYVLLLFH
jgi:hypothetical protein